MTTCSCLLVAIIDDEPSFVSLMTDFLTDEGYRVVSWSSGQDAIAMLGNEQPDVVLLDLWMENAETGLQVLRTIRGDEALVSLPVIVTSADLDGLRIHEQFLSDANATTLPKPFNLDDLLHLIEASTSTVTRERDESSSQYDE